MRYVVVLILLLLPNMAIAQLPYNDSPWRTTTTVNGVEYRIWVDQEALNADARNGRSNWNDIQRFFRNYAFGCAPLSWGEKEQDRFLNEGKSQNYIPLDGTTFIPLNIEIVGGTMPTNHPVFRSRRADSMIVTLNNGRRLTSISLTDGVPIPGLSLRSRTTQAINNCWMVKRLLEPVTIYTKAELQNNWTSASSLYNDKPWANISLVPIDNGRKPFTPRDIAKIDVIWYGQRITLGRNQLASYTR